MNVIKFIHFHLENTKMWKSHCASIVALPFYPTACFHAPPLLQLISILSFSATLHWKIFPEVLQTFALMTLISVIF